VHHAAPTNSDNLFAPARSNAASQFIVLRFALFLVSLHCLAAEGTALDAGYRQMYDLRFAEAHESFHQWEQLHPDDPMGPVSDAAAYLFAEFDRLHILQSEFFATDEGFLHMRRIEPDPIVRSRFESALARGRSLADAALQRSPSEENALLATVLRTGLHVDYLALVERRYLASLTELKQGRDIAQQLLAAHPDCYDAYLAIGVENYMLSLKPAPLRWLLRLGGAETDKDVGIANLRLTAEKGHYLMPYARLLLAVAALRDNNRPKARQTLTWLAQAYPRNPLYREELARLQ
jgi:hypothetical protein